MGLTIEVRHVHMNPAYLFDASDLPESSFQSRCSCDVPGCGHGQGWGSRDDCHETGGHFVSIYCYGILQFY